MLSFARAVSLLSTLVVLAACDATDSPTAPSATPIHPQLASASQSGGSERTVDENLYDLAGSLTEIVCDNGQASEPVELEGQIYERFTVLFTPSGVFQAGYHTMPVGLRGVGTISGEEYRVTERDHGSFTQTLMGATGSYRQVISLVGRTSRRSFSLVVRGHYTITANGDIVVEREKAIFTCDA